MRRPPSDRAADGTSRSWSTARRCLAWSTATLTLTLVSALCLALSVVVHLSTGRGACAAAFSTASQLVAGTIEGTCAELSPQQVRLENLRVHASNGTQVVHVTGLDVEPRLSALWNGWIRLDRVHVHRPTVSLARSASGKLALLEALRPAEPDAESEGTGIPIRVELESIHVHSGTLTDLPAEGSVQIGALDAGVSLVNDSATAELRSARGWIALPDMVRFRFSETSGSLSIANGELDRVSARSELTTGESSAVVEAHLDDSVARLSVFTEGLPLDDVAGVSGLGTVRGTVRVETELGANSESLPLRVVAEQCHYRELAIPKLTAEVDLTSESARLTSLSVPAWTAGGGWLRATATATYEGEAEFDIDARFPQVGRDATVRRLAPGVHGAVAIEVHGRWNPVAAGSLSAEGSVRIDQARFPGGVVIRSLQADGSVGGTLPTPVVAVDVQTEDLGVGAVLIRKSQLSVRGGPEPYRVEGSVRTAPTHGGMAGTRVQVAVQAGLEPDRRTWVIEGSANARGWVDDPVRVRIERLLLDPESHVELEAVAHAGTSRASADGSYRFDGSVNLNGRWRDVDLAAWAPWVDVPYRVAGLSSGSMSIRGSIDKPTIETSLAVRDGRAGDLAFDRFDADAELAADHKRAFVRATTRLTGGGEARIRATGVLGRAPALVHSMKNANWRGELNVDEFPLAGVQAFLPRELPELGGMIFVRGGFSGTLADPESALHVSGRALSAAEDPMPDFDGWVEVSRAGLALRAELTQDSEALLETSLRIEHRLRIEEFRPDQWLDGPWSLDVELAEQRLDQLPGPLRVEVPVRLGGTLHAERDRGAPIHATLDTRGQVAPSQIYQGACDWEHPVDFTSRVTLERGRATARLSASTDSREVLHGTASAATPVETWLATGVPSQLPEVAAALAVERLPTSALPMICEENGLIDGDVALAGFLGEHPALSVEMTVSEFSAGDGADEAELHVEGHIEDEQVVASAAWRQAEREALNAEIRAPVAWGGSQWVPEVEIERARATARLDDVPLGPLVGFVPGVRGGTGAVSGELEAQARFRQSVPDLDVRGQIRFQGAGFTIESPLFRVAGLEGAIDLRRDRLLLSGVRFRDRTGTVGVDGRIDIGSDFTARAIDLDVTTDEYPLRVDGVVLATVNGRAHVVGQTDANRRRVDVTLRNLAVEVPERVGRTVQSLETHSDVYYENDPLYRVAHMPRPEDVPDDPTSSIAPTHISIDASEPFWVRQNTSAMQLTASLAVRLSDSGLRVRGPINVLRGFVVVPTVGERFELNPGRIRFDGSRKLDPLLNLEAVHSAAGGETITLYITGRLSRPELRFVSSEGDLTNLEILEAAFGGNNAGADDDRVLGDQVIDGVVGGLASLSSGLLGDLTRREYGDLIPVLRIDTDVSGRRQSGGVRAGIQADRLIPEFLEGVITGAYLEGFISASHEEDKLGASVTGSGGFLLELYLPSDLTTRATYQEPTNWSLDLTWEP